MSTTDDPKCVGLSEVRDMTGSGEHLVIRSVTGEELIGTHPWCPKKSDAAWRAHRVNDDARLDLALELTFPASDPVAVSSREGEAAPGAFDSLP